MFWLQYLGYLSCRQDLTDAIESVPRQLRVVESVMIPMYILTLTGQRPFMSKKLHAGRCALHA